LHILFVAGMNHHIRHFADDAVAHFQHFLRGLSGGVFDAAVIIQGDVFPAHDLLQEFNLMRRKVRGAL